MIHGSEDEVVPVLFSKKILSLFSSKNKKLVIIKKGDHSLSSNKNLKILLKELNSILKTIH